MEDKFLIEIENTLDIIAYNKENEEYVFEKIVILKMQIKELTNEIYAEFQKVINSIDNFYKSSERVWEKFYIIFLEAKEILHRIYIKRIETLQSELEDTGVEEFVIGSANISELIITGSYDMCYAQEIEIKFKNIDLMYFRGTFFRISKIRLATLEELKIINLENYRDGIVVCLEDDWAEERHYVACHNFSYKWETVYYYMRENLKPGERISEGVLKRHWEETKNEGNSNSSFK